MSREHEDRLRTALAARADAVDPTTDGLARVEARAQRVPPWFMRPGPVAAVVAAVALVVAGVVLLRDDGRARVDLAGDDTTTTTTSRGARVDVVVVWDETFADPTEAAVAFSRDVLAMFDPQGGDAVTSPDDDTVALVDVRPGGSGPTTTVHLARLGDEWAVTATTAENIDVNSPRDRMVASPVTVSGRSSTFEAALLVLVFDGPGDDRPIAEVPTMGGSFEAAPFSVDVEFGLVPEHPTGWVLVYESDESGRGQVLSATVVPVKFTSQRDSGAERPCTGTPADPVDDRAIVLAHFHCGEEQVVAVERSVPATTPVRGAIEGLLAGPTPAEADAGLTSFFSDATADLLSGVTLRPDGTAVVDFDRSLAETIPNASTSAGSRALLEQLDATVFQFTEVGRVEYRLGGSCQAFWDWLQVGTCETRPRVGGSVAD